MRHLIILLLMSASAAYGQGCTKWTWNPFTDKIECASHTATPMWRTWSVVATAAASCVGGVNKCWKVNGVEIADLEGDTSQDLVLFALPAKYHVAGSRIKTTVACAGGTTISAGLGTAASAVLFTAATFDLKAAVSAIQA